MNKKQYKNTMKQRVEPMRNTSLANPYPKYKAERDYLNKVRDPKGT